MEYRGKKEKKFDFLDKKKCAIKSLYEINCFLSNLTKVCTVKKFINKL